MSLSSFSLPLPKSDADFDFALKLVANEFAGVTDGGGAPYILHCLFVSENAASNDPAVKIIGLLHDLIEDTDWSAEELRAFFSERIVSGIVAVTKVAGESYDDYLTRLAENPDAVLVKRADLTHNMNLTRLPEITDHVLKRLKKYHKAWNFLKNK